MSRNSNIEELMAGLERFVDGFNFHRKGIDQSLGRDVAMTIVRGPDVGSTGGMMGRTAAGVTPDGTPWPENSEEYSKEKERLYGWQEVNRRTSQMTSQASLYGRTRIDEKLITMIYGEDKPPDVSRAPTGYLSKQDRKTTDVEKATFAHQQGRGFYGFNEEDRKNVIKVAQENLNGYIAERNQHNGTG